MSLFLATFFLLYGAVHSYVYLRARNALGIGVGPGIGLGLFMILMVSAPVIVRLAERRGLEPLAMTMAHGGYAWMGFLFILFVTLLCTDLIRLGAYVTGMATGIDTRSVVGARRIFFVAALLIAVPVAIYGYVEAHRIRVDRVTITTPKLPAGMGTLRIAQISDVHLGLMVREGRLRRIVEAVKSTDPHILVSTGDLVDGQINNLNGLIVLLKEIEPPHGKYAVTGNHEYYAGIGVSLEFAEKTGFRMLRGEGVTVGDFVNLVGVDDIAGRPYGLYVDVTEKELLGDQPQGLFTILLKHRPVVDPESVGSFDLQLSGHVHKGQIFPFRLLTRIAFTHVSGLIHLGRGSALYVNRGSGTWGPPIRLLAPPEVTLIELKSDPG